MDIVDLMLWISILLIASALCLEQTGCNCDVPFCEHLKA